jgi:hypothetical protein
MAPTLLVQTNRQTKRYGTLGLIIFLGYPEILSDFSGYYALVTGAGFGHERDVAAPPDGSFTYQPNANFTNVDGFEFVVSDGLLTSTGHVTFIVTARERSAQRPG